MRLLHAAAFLFILLNMLPVSRCSAWEAMEMSREREGKTTCVDGYTFVDSTSPTAGCVVDGLSAQQRWGRQDTVKQGAATWGPEGKQGCKLAEVEVFVVGRGAEGWPSRRSPWPRCALHQEGCPQWLTQGTMGQPAGLSIWSRLRSWLSKKYAPFFTNILQ